MAPGDRAADFELQSLSGKTVSLSDLLGEGKPVILSFFGTWCDVCLKEIKELPEVAAKNGAAVYLVGLDGDKEKLARFAEKNGIKFPVLWDPRGKTMGRRYDVLRGALLLVPKTVVVTPEAEVAYAADSYDEKSRSSLAAVLAQLKDRKWGKPRELAIFFTGSANGRLTPVYSVKRSGGGYAKLLPFLKQQEAKYGARVLLDSGDFLPYGVTAAQARRVLRAMELAGYDAAAVGDQDLHFDGFMDEAAAGRLPFLSSNVRLKASPEAGRFASERVLSRGGLKIKIVSCLGPEAFSLYPDEFAGKFDFKGLKDHMARGDADLLVLLSHAGLEENRKLAAEYPGVDLIIGGHSQESAAKSEKAGGALIVQPGGNLQAVGRVLVRFNAARRPIGASYEALQLGDSLPEDPRVTALAAEAAKK